MYDQEKINEYIKSTLSNDDSIQNIPAGPIFKKYGYVGKFDTTRISSLSLKPAEFFNTIIDLFFADYLQNVQLTGVINKLKNDYINLFEELDIEKKSIDYNAENRIFLDITFSISQRNKTGIPRVVGQLLKYGFFHGVIPIIIHSGSTFTYDFKKQTFIEIVPKTNDTIIFPDASWNYLADLDQVMAKNTKAGGRNIFILYDLIPITYPLLSNGNHITAFKKWLNLLTSQSYAVIAISQSVADDFLLHIKTSFKKFEHLEAVGWFHLGSNFHTNKNSNASPNLCEITKKISPYFISVGTIEPRKAYGISLEAMDEIWRLGVNASYVIVGKYGWSQSELRSKILNHSEYGRRLYWYDSLSDGDLQYLYSNARALISTSLSEGFGLPLIEAAHYNLPAIVSDIPVFREIGGQTTKYFEVTNCNELATRLVEAINEEKITPDIKFLKWDDAVGQLLSMIKQSSYQYQII